MPLPDSLFINGHRVTLEASLLNPLSQSPLFHQPTTPRCIQVHSTHPPSGQLFLHYLRHLSFPTTATPLDLQLYLDFMQIIRQFQMQSMYESFLVSVVRPGVDSTNCLYFAGVAFQQLKQSHPESISKAYYQLLNHSVNTSAEHLFSLMNSQQMAENNTKIQEEIIERGLKKHFFISTPLQLDQLMQVLNSIRRTTSLNELLSSQEKQVFSKQIHLQSHPCINWKINNHNSIITSISQQFKFNTFQWAIEMHVTQPQRQIMLRLKLIYDKQYEQTTQYLDQPRLSVYYLIRINDFPLKESLDLFTFCPSAGSIDIPVPSHLVQRLAHHQDIELNLFINFDFIHSALKCLLNKNQIHNGYQQIFQKTQSQNQLDTIFNSKNSHQNNTSSNKFKQFFQRNTNNQSRSLIQYDSYNSQQSQNYLQMLSPQNQALPTANMIPPSQPQFTSQQSHPSLPPSAQLKQQFFLPKEKPRTRIFNKNNKTDIIDPQEANKLNLTDEVADQQHSQQRPYHSGRMKNMNEVVSKNSKISANTSQEKAVISRKSPSIVSPGIHRISASPISPMTRSFRPSASPIELSSQAIPSKREAAPEPDNLSDSDDDMKMSEYSKIASMKITQPKNDPAKSRVQQQAVHKAQVLHQIDLMAFVKPQHRHKFIQ